MPRSLALVALFACLLPAIANARPAFTSWADAPVATVEGVSEYRLPNGLRVLLYPDPSSSNFAVTVAYMVGSRHEGLGEKGMAHLLEHLLFKGTPNCPNINKALKDHGATSNAQTWLDRTIYFESMTATDENLRFAVSMEADRMVNSFIAAEALASEMTVVRNEFEMGESDPFTILFKSLYAKAYTWHPYRDATIGNRADIERVPADNLRRFYKHHYRPQNAVLTFAGKFDPPALLALIDKHFAPLKNPPEPLAGTWTDEPTQDGPRHVEIRREGTQASVGVFYHTPAGAHPDGSAITLFNPLLSDVPWGRMHKELVIPKLAASVQVIAYGLAERGQLVVIATLNEGQRPEAALSKIQEVMEGFSTRPVTDLEAQRAKASMLSQIKNAWNDNLNFAYDLAQFSSVGDWRLAFVNRDRIKVMTAQTMQAAAVKYFVPDNRTSGVFLPTKAPTRAQVPPAPSIESVVGSYTGSEPPSAGEAFDADPLTIESRVSRFDLGPSIKLAVLPKKTRGRTVRISMSVRFGDERSLAGRGVTAELLASMLVRGTTTRDFQQHSDDMDRMQSAISAYWDNGVLKLDVSTTHEHVTDLVDQALDVVRNPTFPESEFRAMIGDRVGFAESQLSDPQALAWNALNRAVAPRSATAYFYLPSLQERLQALKSCTVSDLRSMFDQQVGPSSVQIAAVGDFDPEPLRDQLAKSLAGWSQRLPYRRPERRLEPVAPGAQTITVPDKPMATVGLATAFAMSNNDPDAPALRIASSILGRGLSSRLGQRLREKDGLSYDFLARMQSEELDEFTSLLAYAICARENADKTAAAMMEEVRRWINDGVTREELDDARKNNRLSVLRGFGSDSTLAETLRDGLFLGRTLKWNADRLDAVDKLTVEEVNGALKRRLAGLAFHEVRAGDLAPPPPPLKP